MKLGDYFLTLMLGATIYSLLSINQIQRSELICPAPPQCPDMWAQMQEEFINNHQYKANEYTCVNYSNDWATIRNLMGYETNTISNGTHRYISYAYEPQNGQFIKNK